MMRILKCSSSGSITLSHIIVLYRPNQQVLFVAIIFIARSLLKQLWRRFIVNVTASNISLTSLFKSEIFISGCWGIVFVLRKSLKNKCSPVVKQRLFQLTMFGYLRKTSLCHHRVASVHGNCLYRECPLWRHKKATLLRGLNL